MKFSIVILLFTALLAQSFSRSLALTDYLFNLEAYNKKCINKAKPMLNCNGKCQLLKKTKQQTGENGSSSEMPKFDEPDFVWSSKSHFPSLRFPLLNIDPIFNESTILLLPNHFGTIFHPPSV